jgi:hypothetical protein
MHLSLHLPFNPYSAFIQMRTRRCNSAWRSGEELERSSIGAKCVRGLETIGSLQDTVLEGSYLSGDDERRQQPSGHQKQQEHINHNAASPTKRTYNPKKVHYPILSYTPSQKGSSFPQGIGWSNGVIPPDRNYKASMFLQAKRVKTDVYMYSAVIHKNLIYLTILTFQRPLS